MYCIYHSADLDGYSSAAIVKRKYPFVELIGYDYGKPMTAIDAIPDGEDIIIVDVSICMDKAFPMREMEALAKRSASL